VDETEGSLCDFPKQQAEQKSKKLLLDKF